MFKNGLQIGLMLFGMFFGAGNLIFPPSLGFESGSMFTPAILGFLLSGIGMPVIALIIGTFNPGGFRAEMNQKISPAFSLLLLALIYLSIGPLMAIPRTAATSFSIGVLPITGDGTLPLALFTIVYFAFAWWLAITPTKLLARLGKVLTPMFALLIVILMLTGLLAYTTTSLAQPLGKYSASAFGTGFIEGYNTMDTLASFAFCILALNEMRRIHFHSAREHYTSVWMAGLAVAVLMGALYLGLALLGTDPLRPARRVNPGGRYAAMERYFVATRTASAGAAMMTSTASVQVNLDAGPRAGWTERVRLAHALGPTMIAIAANSPMLA